ncbi:mitochondrial inner membrane protein Mitofilin [Hypoxylon rubiginosum]|uniref:Mitochondrial inner membrane protein Mitofilin n=1 Tax=Hypoxylon rubiginosum TaxID=110542 RepID=A0ACC0CSS7_9PEZI|nr:mitochondrial inner membrane protein Mitofilin [Hypoxylon rubiginosum]
MLRTSLRSVKAVGSRPIAAAAGRQWQSAIARSPGASVRYFADDKKPSINDPTPVKLPTSETTTAASSDPPELKLESRVASSTIEPKDVPPTPPPPPPASTTTVSKPSPSPAVPVKKKKGFFRRLRNYVLTLVLLGAVTFGGGVWYSRVSDNFHDFFTEYVPFGEQAVLYFEELDYKKRYPGGLTIGGRNNDTGGQVKISPQSGASWRVADTTEPATRQSSAMQNITANKSSTAAPESDKKDAPAPKPAEPAKSAAPTSVPAAATQAVEKEAPKKASSKAKASKKDAKGFVPPEVDEPSRFPPASPIDPLKVRDADEPVVQDLVKMLNDIITVVNADNSDDRFSSTIGKAKNELNKVGSKIRELKAKVEKDAASQVASKVKEFEGAAVQLVGHVEKVMEAQERQWRAEFDEEMKRVQETYDARIKTEIEREKRINEEKANNLLLEQAVSLKRQFLNDVKARVEEERNGRLGKLDQLSSAVKELETLTTGWNDVVDTNLKTQQLHVAVEAVRASLSSDTEHPRPFVRELVALKEIATEDPVVNAAIGSINPSAYQRGIATPSQLIDRFRRVANEVRKASLLPDDAGVASHASSWVLSKVLFKKQGLAAGDDVESVLTRTQTFLEEGDLDAAAREMNGLQGWAKTLSRDWLAEVRKVLEVQQALEVIATEARLQSLRVE